MCILTWTLFSFHSCTVSAPGKILVAGGYLVLERPNIGITLAASSRFFASVCEQVHVPVLEDEEID